MFSQTIAIEMQENIDSTQVLNLSDELNLLNENLSNDFNLSDELNLPNKLNLSTSRFNLPIEFCDCENSNIYEKPYSFFENCPDRKGIKTNTGIFVGGAVGVMGLLYLAPESVTRWDKSSFNPSSVFGKWQDNVAAGPVIDEDNGFMNYIAHPYWGAVYYMGARSLGYNAINSMLYSAMMSTFVWEYGFEAFAEIPSTQDLIITPVAGAIVGELFYLAKRKIIQNDYRIFNSKVLGHFTTFLIDPINEFANLFARDKIENNNLENNNLTLTFNLLPSSTKNDRLGYYFSLFYRF